MQDLPQQWAEYALLQARSSRISTIDSYSWGIEEEMNLFLENPHTYMAAEAESLERVRVTAARRERSRARLRKVHEAELAPESADPIPQLEVREALRQIESKVTSTQWALIEALGQGYNYADISLKQAISAGAARTQISRLRQQFSELRPAA
jgi:DNA-directed RNA polymerase specialized sigma24 family protein